MSYRDPNLDLMEKKSLENRIETLETKLAEALQEVKKLLDKNEVLISDKLSVLPKYEYRIINLYTLQNEYSNKILTNLGNEGWELIQIDHSPIEILGIFKRRLNP